MNGFLSLESYLNPFGMFWLLTAFWQSTAWHVEAQWPQCDRLRIEPWPGTLCCVLR